MAENKNDEIKEETKSPETAPIDPGEELVEYTAPLLDAHGESPDIFVGVNGKNILIKRGETVRIKRKFLEVIRNSEEQDRAAYRARQAAQRQANTPIADM